MHFKQNNKVAQLFFFFSLQSKTLPSELPLRFPTFKSVASEEEQEWCAPLSPKSHFYSIYIHKGGRCCLPGFLQAAMHISFVLERCRLINVCNDKHPSISFNTGVQFLPQKEHLICVPEQDENVSRPALPHSDIKAFLRTVYQRRCTEIGQILVVARCSETTTYFHWTICKPRDHSHPPRAAPGSNLALNNLLNTFAS